MYKQLSFFFALVKILLLLNILMQPIVSLVEIPLDVVFIAK
jgi:uncharacterized membrane protein YvlD (DUF360 family)